MLIDIRFDEQSTSNGVAGLDLDSHLKAYQLF